MKYKTPAILFGDNRTDFTSEEFLVNFKSAIHPVPQGLGLTNVGSYYSQNNDTSLFSTLQGLR